ncbi:MAG: hypothetical protein WA975_03285 [Mesorhizobium sp.]
MADTDLIKRLNVQAASWRREDAFEARDPEAEAAIAEEAATALSDQAARIAELETELYLLRNDRANKADQIYDLETSLTASCAECEGLRAALDRLVNAKALSGIRAQVAGWNGENRQEGPYNERHPSRLGARIETNCGRIYELDEIMQEARAALASVRE